jgi:NAD(P)-dependent dehydrogenase (short-subunit alcohol dehydrogenase family)
VARSRERDFRGRVVIVTGAASGIGRALVRRLARAGAVTTAADIDAAGLAALAAEGIATAAFDVRDGAAFARAAEDVLARHGRIDCLFNVAGVAAAGELPAIAAETWRRVMDVNLMGVLHGVQAVYPAMAQARSGRIVNVASIAGLLPFPMLAPYCASKFAVVGLTECLRHEAAAHGIAVTLVCPGFVDTGIYDRADVPAGYPDSRELLPFRRLDVERAVTRIIGAAARRRARVVFPAYWRWCWRLWRLWPPLLTRDTRRYLADARAEIGRSA